MKTLTVRLPEALVAQIEAESRRRKLSKSDVVRERLRKPTGVAPGATSTRELIGDILEASWKARVPVGPPRFRSAHKQKLGGIIRAKKLHR